MSENRKLTGLSAASAAALDTNALTYVVLGTGESRKVTLGDLGMAIKTTGSALPIANGGTGATSAAAARTLLGLGAVDNTSDAAKPVSTATQTALNLKAGLASPVLTGDVAIASTGNSTLPLQSDAVAQVIVKRHISNSSPPTLTMQKSRGTAAAPTAVVQNDLGLNLAVQGHDGAGTYRNLARIEARVKAAAPSATDMEGEWVFYTTPPGSVTATETMRLSSTEGLVANGFRTFGGVINATGVPQNVFSCVGQRSGTFLLSAESDANGYYAVALLILHGGKTIFHLTSGGGVSWSLIGYDVYISCLSGYNATWSASRLG